MSRNRRVEGRGSGLGDDVESVGPAWKGMVKMWVAMVYTMRSSNVFGAMAGDETESANDQHMTKRDRHLNPETVLTRNSSYDHRHPRFPILGIWAQIPLHLIHARQMDQLDPLPALSLRGKLFYRHPDLFSVPVRQEDGVHP
jgi:hypothetical protein